MAYYRIGFDSDEGIESSMISSISNADAILPPGMQKRHTLKRFKRIKAKLSQKSIEEVVKQYQSLISSASKEIDSFYSPIRDQLDVFINELESIPDDQFTHVGSTERRKDILSRVFKERYSNNLEKDIKLRIFDYLSKDVLKDSRLELRSKVKEKEGDADFKDDVAKFEMTEIKKVSGEIHKKLKRMIKKLNAQLEEAEKPIKTQEGEIVHLDSLKKYFVDKLWSSKQIIEGQHIRRIELKESKIRLNNKISSLREKLKSAEEKNGESEDFKPSRNMKDKIKELKAELQKVLAEKRGIKTEVQRQNTDLKIIEATKDEILGLIQEAEQVDSSVTMDIEYLSKEVEKGSKEFDLLKGLYNDIERLVNKHDTIRGYPNFRSVSKSVKTLKNQTVDVKVLEGQTDELIQRIQTRIEKRTTDYT